MLSACQCSVFSADHSPLHKKNESDKMAHFKGVQTYVAMVILVAMHCSMRLRPFGIKVKFQTSIYLTTQGFSVLGNCAYSIYCSRGMC